MPSHDVYSLFGLALMVAGAAGWVLGILWPYMGVRLRGDPPADESAPRVFTRIYSPKPIIKIGDWS